jgi:signal transduction histidine kinase
MSQARWTVWLAVAWLAPLVWLALLPFMVVSDGAVVSSPTAVLDEGRWGESLLVLETYGDTPLRRGDRILEVQGRPVAELVATRDAAAVNEADVLSYRVRRPEAGLDLIREVDVRLVRYPVVDALAANASWVGTALGLLLAGTFLALRRTRPMLAGITVGAGAALLVGVSGQPFGAQPVAVSGATGLWPHLVGELVLVLGLGAVAVAVWSFPRPPARLVPGGALLLLAAPYAAYAVWVVGYAVRQPAPAQLQAQLDLLLPAAVAAGLLVAVGLATGWGRAESTDEQVALRLLVLAAFGAVLIVGVLDVVPRLVRGSPLVPRELVALAVVPVVLGCWVAAVLGYRLVEIDTTLRRSLVQGLIAAAVGGVFVATASAVNLASGTSVTALVTGGVVALALLPIAVLLRRAVSRLVYGDRAFPYRVVSELRRLEPTTAPETALEDVLALLSRSLRLSYASVETAPTSGDHALRVAVGQRRGRPTTVELAVAGSRVGVLEMEVDPLREPFGPRDRRLLEDVGTQVGALVQALAGNRELQHTRERLVTAREEERRRLRRDLHDGLGPSLATQLMRLEVARELVDRDPAEAALLLDQLTDQAEADIVEIRRLVDGLRPPALDQLGLVSALRERAAQHNHAVELAPSGLTWSVEADDLGPLPAAVEVAAYRIVVEAVTNAVRHSGGRRCEVVLRRRPGALELEIGDDGAGASGPGGTGVGLGSMRDRAEELGGTCSVSTAPGGGTLVSAVLPVAGPVPPEHGPEESD